MMQVRVRKQYIGAARQPVWTGSIAYVHTNGRTLWTTGTGILRVDKQTATQDGVELLAQYQRLTPTPLTARKSDA